MAGKVKDVVDKGSTPVSDGRRLRSERSQQAIVDASHALISEGNLIPTAQQIADRAGVGIRSFFRHFADMETLFEAVDAATRESTEALLPVVIVMALWLRGFCMP